MYSAALAAQTDHQLSWGRGIAGDRYYVVPLYPDANANYWSVNYDNRGPERVALSVTGEFPYARYMSFHVYDARKGDVVATLRDNQVEPDAGNINPYRPFRPRNLPQRSYTFRVVPEGSSHAGEPNTIVVPDSVKTVTMIFRIYRPDRHVGNQGGVDLPGVKAYDDVTGLPISADDIEVPQEEVVSFLRRALDANSGGSEDRIRVLDKTLDESISFYRFDGAGGFPNEDTPYVATSLGAQLMNDTAVFRFKPPTFLNTFHGGGFFTGQEQVRYWSLSIGGDVLTNMSSALWDDIAMIDEDGFVYVVVGNFWLRNRVESAGVNFLPLGLHQHRSLVFRHMVPQSDFSESTLEVPFFKPNQPLDPQRAENFMGEFAPVGIYMTTAELFDWLNQR